MAPRVLLSDQAKPIIFTGLQLDALDAHHLPAMNNPMAKKKVTVCTCGSIAKLASGVFTWTLNCWQVVFAEQQAVWTVAVVPATPFFAVSLKEFASQAAVTARHLVASVSQHSPAEQMELAHLVVA